MIMVRENKDSNVVFLQFLRSFLNVTNAFHGAVGVIDSMENENGQIQSQDSFFVRLEGPVRGNPACPDPEVVVPYPFIIFIGR